MYLYRRRVCLHVIDLGDKTTTVEMYIQMLKDWIDEINARPNSKKPHFILMPMGDEYNILLNKYIHDKYGIYGFNVPTVGSCAPVDAFNPNYRFSFTPVMKSTELALPAIELFHKRLGYRRWMILGDEMAMQYSIDSIQAIVDVYRKETKELINILEKRCSNDRTNFTGINCKSLNDCKSQETCVYPIVKTNNIFISDTIEEMIKWMKLAQSYNPEVLILNVDNNLPSYLEILKSIGYTPNVLMSLTRSFTVITPRLNNIDNTYLYYATAFNENQGYGNDKITSYLGSSDNYVKLVNENLNKYINDTIYSEVVDVENDYEYIARGSLIGITIQRVVEITSTLKNLNYDDDDLYFFSNPVDSYYTVIHNKFDVCDNEDDDDGDTYTQPCNTLTCKSGCKPWITFFGPIGFDVEGMNNELKSTLVQIQSYENYKVPYIVSPSTSPVCNKYNHVCSEKNGFKDCTCNYITPSPWSWAPHEKSSYFTKTGEIIVFYIICILDLIIILSLLLFILKNGRKLKLCKIPSTILLWFILPIIYGINLFTIVGRPSSFSCSLNSILCYISIGVFTFVPYFVNKELHQQSANEDIMIRSEIFITSLHYLLITVNLIVSPVRSEYHSDVIEDRIVYYYTCSNYNLSTMFSYFIWILIVFQAYYLIKGQLKRNKLVFILQSYYLYIYNHYDLTIYLIRLLTFIYGIVSIINNYLLPYERSAIVLLFLFFIIFGFFYIIPFIIIIFMKITSSLMKDHSLTKVSQKRKELNQFLKNRIYRTHMIIFSESLKMSNYIEFYYEIMKFERIKVKEHLEGRAYSILTKYIENSFVDLPVEIKANIMNHFSAVRIDIFSESKNYVFNILLNEFWDRFKASEYYVLALDDQIIFRYIQTRTDVIMRSVLISLGVSILFDKLTTDEKEEILSIQKPKSSSYKLSQNSKISKSNSRRSRAAIPTLSSKHSEISLK